MVSSREDRQLLEMSKSAGCSLLNASSSMEFMQLWSRNTRTDGDASWSVFALIV